MDHRRRDRRLLANQTGKRESVVVMRERDGLTVTSVGKLEAAGVSVTEATVAEGSTVYADDASNVLHAKYLTKRINHSVCYSDGEACTNMAESFFSRLRRAEIGIHHKIAGPYLNAYSSEMAWRENYRRTNQRRAISRRRECRCASSYFALVEGLLTAPPDHAPLT